MRVEDSVQTTVHQVRNCGRRHAPGGLPPGCDSDTTRAGIVVAVGAYVHDSRIRRISVRNVCRSSFDEACAVAPTCIQGPTTQPTDRSTHFREMRQRKCSNARYDETFVKALAYVYLRIYRATSYTRNDCVSNRCGEHCRPWDIFSSECWEFNSTAAVRRTEFSSLFPSVSSLFPFLFFIIFPPSVSVLHKHRPTTPTEFIRTLPFNIPLYLREMSNNITFGYVSTCVIKDIDLACSRRFRCFARDTSLRFSRENEKWILNLYTRIRMANMRGILRSFLHTCNRSLNDWVVFYTSLQFSLSAYTHSA